MAALNFRKAHEVDSSNDQALYGLGMCLLKQGKKAEADKLIAASYELSTASRQIKNFENLCNMEPRNRPVRLRLARLYRKYGNVDDARKRYVEYMRMGAPDPAVEKEIAAYRAQLSREAAAAKSVGKKTASAQAKS